MILTVSPTTATGLLPESVLVDHARTRACGPPAEDLPRHRARFGPRPAGDADLLRAVEAAGLTGHGGAHVPAARRWRAVLAAGGAPVVVANAAEGEPLSAKDFALLQARPHLVLDGLLMVAELVGAQRCVVWAHSGPAGRAVTEAVAARRDPRISVVEAPAGYLTGQSSAVARGLAGGPALPTFGPTSRRGGPLVHNVETLARVALSAYRVPSGGLLVTVLGCDGLRVHETAPGTTLRELVPGAPQAILVGGFGGSWHRFDDVAADPLADVAGGGRRALGAGVLAPVGSDACGLRETAAMLAFLAGSSARQCGPCTFGTRALADAMARLATGSRGSAVAPGLSRELADEIDGRGACRLPDGASWLARSALRVFGDDARRHARRSPCPPGRLTIPVPELPR